MAIYMPFLKCSSVNDFLAVVISLEISKLILITVEFSVLATWKKSVSCQDFSTHCSNILFMRIQLCVNLMLGF